MKIIEKLDTSSWSHNCNCSNCETKLEVEATDLHHTHSEADGTFPASDNYSAQCPVCSHYITVPVNELPKIVQVQVKQKSWRGPSSYYDR